MHPKASVLIIDDDPMHIRIYGWIIEAAGFRAIPAEVRSGGVDLPNEPADIVLLDYNLQGRDTAVRLAEMVHARFPQAPVILLSDVYGLPEDIAPHVQEFVRKGDPAKLVDKLHTLLGYAAAPVPEPSTTA